MEEGPLILRVVICSRSVLLVMLARFIALDWMEDTVVVRAVLKDEF